MPMPGSNGAAAMDKGTPRGRRAAWLAVLAVLLAFGSGCERESKPDLSIINGAEPEALDPALVAAQPDTRITLALFAGLARNDPVTGAAIPDLASNWDISPDGKTYTFHLRPNLRWSTGEPINAGDFVYSWRRALDPATAASYAGPKSAVRSTVAPKPPNARA